LRSITRERIVELTGARERSCTLAQLEGADEAFLASTTREVQPVSAIDETELAPGPRTRAIAEQLHRRIRSELD
jgi:branched-chain amino acid aminotransferase